MVLFIVLLEYNLASAQTAADKERARAAADAGAIAIQTGQYAEAISRFNEAEALVHAPPHLLNIARAHERLGHLLAARETYLTIAKEILGSTAPHVFKDARAAALAELDTIEPRIPKVTIIVQRGSDPLARVSDATVTLDGQIVIGDSIGEAQLVDPGDHKFVASAPAMLTVEKTAHFEEAVQETVTLELLPVLPAAEPPKAAPPPAPVPPVNRWQSAELQTAPSSYNYQRTLAYSAFGVGALGLAGGTVFYVAARGSQNDADSQVQACRPRCTNENRASVEALDAKAADRRNFATIGFVGGSVGVVAGVALLVFSGRREAPKHASALEPWMAPGLVGVRGQF